MNATVASLHVRLQERTQIANVENRRTTIYIKKGELRVCVQERESDNRRALVCRQLSHIVRHTCVNRFFRSRERMFFAA